MRSPNAGVKPATTNLTEDCSANHLLAERTALCGKARFKPGRAVAIVAGPALGAVQILAAAACVRVLNFQKFEMFFPIGTLFLKRRGTVTDLNPLQGPVVELAGFRHISEIFISGDRSSAERAVFN